MGFFQRWFDRSVKNSTLDLFRQIYGGRESHSGITVNLNTALEDDTVFACCRVLMDGVAQVPQHLIREVDNRRAVAVDDPLDDLLNRRPNAWQTSFEFRETQMLHLLLDGNFYAFVNRVGRTREIREIVPLEPHRVRVTRKSDFTLEYEVRADDGSSRTFAPDAIWHVRGPSWNSWMGLHAIKMARNAIGLSAALEQGQSEFQKNGAQGSAVLSVEDRLDKAQFEKLSAWIDRHQLGGDRYGKPFIVDRNGKLMNAAMTGVDQQLLETRRNQVEAICRRFRVMPLMIGHPADMAARAATDSIFQMHVVHSLMPWYQRIEQSADVQLLSDEQRRSGNYVKLNANALMRGNAKDRAEYYAKALGSGGTKGWMTQNEVRALEDIDRSDDPKADELPQPTAKESANGLRPKADTEPDPDDEESP